MWETDECMYVQNKRQSKKAWGYIHHFTQNMQKKSDGLKYYTFFQESFIF